MEKLYWLYILASRPRGALYIGMTNDLGGRVYQPRTGTGSEHADRYRIWRLVYTESYVNVWNAIAREKQLKKWTRARKVRLIEASNARWNDLYDQLV